LSEFDLKLLSAALEDLDSTMSTVPGRPFDPGKDGAVILRGGNVTADTRFGGLDVVQRLSGVPAYSELAEDAIESDLLGIRCGCAPSAGYANEAEAEPLTGDQVDLENLPED
jgi:hypothetical protein